MPRNSEAPEKEAIPMRELPGFDKEGIRVKRMHTLMTAFIESTNNYLQEAKNHHELDDLIKAFFFNIQRSKHYLRRFVNNHLLEIIVRDTKFKHLGLEKTKMLKKITPEVINAIKIDLLDIIGKNMIIDAPIPKEKKKGSTKPKAAIEKEEKVDEDEPE